ncbi:uncharacterized protein [Leptinotarsa decemlineata]|uniref:uncharacterized protein n=1 Tax=Leptinotarsa decemlineata TaxID=7539 RepID=UPI003D3069FE
MAKIGINNTNCCVRGCHSKKGRSASISFHRFPGGNKFTVRITNEHGVVEKVDRHEMWIKNLNIVKKLSNRATVCSLHFTKDAFILPDCPTQRRRLKSTAIPTVKLPEPTQGENSSTKRTTAGGKHKDALRLSDDCLVSISLNEQETKKVDHLSIKKVDRLSIENCTNSEKQAVEALLSFIPTHTNFRKRKPS